MHFDRQQPQAKARALARGLLRPSVKRPPWLGKQNAMAIATAFSVANNVVGDYLEFGVLEGASFMNAYKQHEREFSVYKARQAAQGDEFLRYERRFFAFDSFAGLPVVAQDALPLHWRGERVMTAAEESFVANVVAAGVSRDAFVTVPGFYEESLTDGLYSTLGLSRAAIVHIDCDIYESTVSALDFITPLVVNGTVLVFDDWFYYTGHPAKGEQGAFREWMARHPEFVATELCTIYPVAAFIVNRAASAR